MVIDRINSMTKQSTFAFRLYLKVNIYLRVHIKYFSEESVRGRTTIRKKTKIPQSLRDKLLVEAKHQCSKCHEKTTHIHHIVSRADGGTDEYENLIVLCPTCHDNVHMEHITSDQLRLYKKRWIAACRLIEMGKHRFFDRSELRKFLEFEKTNYADRVAYLSKQFKGYKPSSVVDPITPLLSKLVSLLEDASQRISTSADVRKKLGADFFRIYKLLNRVLDNTGKIKEVLDNDTHSDGEETHLEKTNMPRLVGDQAKTIFELYKQLVDKWELFELYIPDFSCHLWALFNRREGLLLPITDGLQGEQTRGIVTIFSRLDELMVKQVFVDWIPYFKSHAFMEYHPTVNRFYNVHNRDFVNFDISKKNASQFGFLSCELARIMGELHTIIKRFGLFLKDNFEIDELAI